MPVGELMQPSPEQVPREAVPCLPSSPGILDPQQRTGAEHRQSCLCRQSRTHSNKIQVAEEAAQIFSLDHPHGCSQTGARHSGRRQWLWEGQPAPEADGLPGTQPREEGPPWKPFGT